MSINFSALPTKNPFVTPKPGIYIFTVSTAEMKEQKDKTKPPYLNMMLSLEDTSGRKQGTIFERVFNSTAPALLYKLQRFVRAIGLQLEGSVELKDLAKLVVNRKGVVEVENIQDNRYPDDPTRQQAQVKLFGSECFWTLDELAQFAKTEPEVSEDAADETPYDPPFDFDAADGEVPKADEY